MSLYRDVRSPLTVPFVWTALQVLRIVEEQLTILSGDKRTDQRKSHKRRETVVRVGFFHGHLAVLAYGT